MVKLKINNNKAMKLYLSFVTDILNDKEGAKEIWDNTFNLMMALRGNADFNLQDHDPDALL